MLEKRATAGFGREQSRITLLGPRGHGLSKLAAPTEAIERFIARITPDDRYYWLHVIALTASEYWGQNRNGDHWGIQGLSYLPEGWTEDPDKDRMLAAKTSHGPATFYLANVFPHHANDSPAGAIGSVELVLWNDPMKWVELIIKLDKAKTTKSRVAWVLERIAQNRPFDLSMGAKVPFDMATTGDMQTYWEAQQSYDPLRHRSPAEAVLAYHRKRKAENGVGIRGLSITRDDYLPECKSSMGDILPNGIRVGVRNDYARYFDISIVFVGADKVAKYVTKLASRVFSFSNAFRTAPILGPALDEAAAMLKAAACKDAEVKEGDITKEVPAAFDEKSVRVLAGLEEDLPENTVARLREHPDLGQALSTLSSLGIVLKPQEYENIAQSREPPALHPSIFDPSLANTLLGAMKRRSALLPALEQRMGAAAAYGGPRDYGPVSAPYQAYRARSSQLMAGGPDEVFGRHPDLWLTLLGRQGRTPLVGPATQAYARHAFMPDLPE